MTEKERLKKLIEIHGSYEAFANRLGIPKTSITNWLMRGLSSKAMRTIALQCPEISLNWLATGNGDILLNKVETKDVITESTAMHVVNNYYADLRVSAGQVGYVNADCEPSPLLVPCNAKADAFFPVSGFSMIPTINEGDIIGVKEVDCFEVIDESKIYVIITKDDERMVKRICPPKDNDDFVKLISDNPKQKEIILQRNMILKLLRVVYIGKSV